jgi:hypothetical protein
VCDAREIPSRSLCNGLRSASAALSLSLSLWFALFPPSPVSPGAAKTARCNENPYIRLKSSGALFLSGDSVEAPQNYRPPPDTEREAASFLLRSGPPPNGVKRRSDFPRASLSLAIDREVICSSELRAGRLISRQLISGATDKAPANLGNLARLPAAFQRELEFRDPRYVGALGTGGSSHCRMRFSLFLSVSLSLR